MLRVLHHRLKLGTLWGLLILIGSAWAQSVTSTTQFQALDMPPVQLRGVRVQPMADAVRLIFQLEKPAAYSIKLDPEAQRATLDLIGVNVPYLPIELTRIDDARLRGIWLKHQGDGLVRLELRLGRPGISLEHFALERPASIVIDLFQNREAGVLVATMDPVRLGKERLQGPGGDVRISPNGTLLPYEMPEFAPDAPSPGSERVQVDGRPQLPPSVLEGHQLRAEQPLPSHGAVVMASDESHAPEEIAPRDSEYDDFPVHAIDLSSPLGKEIFDDFLYARWNQVIQKSVRQYLDRNKINRETAHIMFLLAEARFRVGMKWPEPPLGEMINFYRQALRLHGHGELGAFGHMRLADLLLDAGDTGVALEHARMAQQSESPRIRMRGRKLEARALIALRQHEAAIEVIETLLAGELDPQTRLDVMLARSSAEHDSGDHAAAWASYQEALALDPHWINYDYRNAEKMARSAMDQGHLDKAAEYVQFINHNFTHMPDEESIKLALLYAEVLERQGYEKAAIETYSTLLSFMEGDVRGREVRELMLNHYPEEMVNGEGRYCEMLYRNGRVVEAMEELHNAHEQCLANGIDIGPLEPLIESIVPTFMAHMANHQYPSDAVQAWRYYGQMIEDESARRRCVPPLVDALEQLGLYSDARDFLTWYRHNEPDLRGRTHDRLLVQDARLALSQEKPGEAIALLESPQPELTDSEARIEHYRLLGEAYLAQGRRLEAAQAFQTLAGEPGLDAPSFGDAIVNAGELFNREGMPMQSMELGLKALLFERDRLNVGLGPGWTRETGRRLRRMLAQAYLKQERFTQGIVVLEDYLDNGGLEPDARGEALLWIADARRRNGQWEQARRDYEAIRDDAELDETWRARARQVLRTMEWDEEHPYWNFYPNAPETAQARP